MEQEKPYIYRTATIEFVTVAAETCLFLEHAAEKERAEFLHQILCLLPLLYLKARLLDDGELLLDGDPQRFVQEEDYNYVRLGVQQILGTDDTYLEVFLEDMRYSDEPLSASVSEHLADIYQELKDMAAGFQTGQEEVMNDAVLLCREAFFAHWGQKLLNCLRPLHALSLTEEDEE